MPTEDPNEGKQELPEIPVQTHMDPVTVKRLAAIAAIGWTVIILAVVIVAC